MPKKKSATRPMFVRVIFEYIFDGDYVSLIALQIEEAIHPDSLS